MVVSLIVGIAQNAVRSDPIALFPKAPRPAMTSESDPAEAPARPETIPGVISQSPTLSEEEIASGEIVMERVKTVWEAGTVFIVDARGQTEFDEGHIPGALNIPIDEFVDHYQDLDEQVHHGLVCGQE